MKKSIVLSLALVVFGFANAQETAKPKKVKKAAKVETPAMPKVEGAGMLFEKETIDYGTIKQNADGAREFVFTNNGTKPLIISSTQGSCGCTVPTTPKEPILPGKKGSIGVKYDTNRVGPFTKTVTITSNAEGMATKTVTIKGEVVGTPAPAAPATKG